jgi:flagellar FliL protein
MKKKLPIIAVIALVLAGGVYKFALATPPPKPKYKVDGEVYVIPKEFLVNLKDGRFARVNVALEFDHGYSSAAAAAEAAAGHGSKGAPKPVEGFGILPQEPVVRDIVSDTISDSSARQLSSRTRRERLKKRIAKKINKTTDVKVHDVLFTDVAVQ